MPSPRLPRPLRTRGFSLIEVVIAIGIVAFAFVGLFGLLPVGLTSLDNAIDSTVEAQIIQHVSTMARQASFDALKRDQLDLNPGADANFPQRQAADYFYNEQGEELKGDLSARQQNYVYAAAVFSEAGTAVPGSSAGTAYSNPQIATVRVMITRRSAPNLLRVHTLFVANNGIAVNSAAGP